MAVRTIQLIVATILNFLVCVLAGAINWQRQTVIVCVSTALLMAFANRKGRLAPVYCVLLALPFFILFTVLFFVIEVSPGTYPIIFFGGLTVLVTFLLLQFRVRKWISIAILSFIPLFAGLVGYPTYFAWMTSRPRPELYMPYRSVLVTADGTPVNTDSLLGKVVVLDIWHSACGNCIRDFPKTEALYEQYKDDSLVKVFTLNFPLDRDKGIRPVKLTDPYKFGKLYFRDADEYAKFSAEQLPLLLIMDKEGVCRYAGQLNTGWNIFYGNAHRIIKKLKHEN